MLTVPSSVLLTELPLQNVKKKKNTVFGFEIYVHSYKRAKS